MYEFKMPSLGAEMEAGRLLEWKVRPGDSVNRGQIVAVVDTDKAAVDVEIWQSGVVDRLLVAPGQRVPVGSVLATVRAEGEAPPPAPATAARPRVSPVARKRAAELGLDLASIRGSGPGGTITLGDVERQAPAAPDRKKAMRAAIAATMARAKREIPHYYLGTEIDMGRSLQWLASENLKRALSDRLLYSVLLLKAVAISLKRVPELNGAWQDGVFRPSEAIHLGIAISIRGGGLVAPALHDVDRKSLDEIMRGLQDVVSRARAGSLRGSEMSDPTITVSNLGEEGVQTIFGIIYPPQVALVGFGNIAQRPWASDSSLSVRPVITATLSGDHRVSDGHRGAVFLSTLGKLLQEPEKL